MQQHEDTWRHCSQCEVLFFCGRTRGACPAGSTAHDPTTSGQYGVFVGEPTGAWRWCRKCQTLFSFAPPSAACTRGSCPAGGMHDPSSSGRYPLFPGSLALHAPVSANIPLPPLEGGWARCTKCESLFRAGTGATGGVCPVDLEAHTADTPRFAVVRNDPGPTIGPLTWSNWSEELTAPVAAHFQPSRLDQLVSIVAGAAAATPPRSVRAVGSSWSFSDVAEPTPTSVLVDTSKLGALLWNVLEHLPIEHRKNLVHVEAGVKIHVLNAMLDPLGLALTTLGGSGGQSLAGVISTGTHGGDIDLPPIADMIRAVHLVGAGGKQHWIERRSGPVSTHAQIAAALPFLDPANIHYDDSLFDSVITSMGALGVIYSVVVQARTPYDLEETTVQMTWPQVSAGLTSGSIFMRTQPDGAPYLDDAGNPERVRFLQIVMAPNSPGSGPRQCFVTTRQEAQPSPNIRDTSPGGPDVMTVLCNLDWGPIIALAIPIVTGAILAAGAIAAAAAGPFGPFVLFVASIAAGAAATVLTALAVSNPSLERAIAEFANILDTLGLSALMRDLNNSILSSNLTVGTKQDRSYRIMDTFNYAAPDCYLVDSMESFFDANAPGFVATLQSIMNAIDANGNVFGYLSLRFTGATKALLGMQQATLNCSAELSILEHVADNDRVLRAVQDVTLASGGRLHWGQRNERLTAAALTPLMYPGLARWRAARSTLSAAPTFDNVFTARLGL